jgi:hypothetical protein
MKALTLILSLLIGQLAYAQSHNWLGTYTYVKDYGRNAGGNGMIVEEKLSIKKSDNKRYHYQWTYDVAGYQTFYVIKGYAIDKGDFVDFFVSDFADGVYRQQESIDKTQPFFKMSVQEGQILTRWMQPQAQKKFRVYFKPSK